MSGDDLILELGKGLTNLDNAALMRMGHHLLRGETGQLANVLHGYAHDVHSFTKGHAAFELGRRSYAFNHPLDTLFEDDLADEYKDYLVDLAGVASEQVSQKVNESLEQARIDGLTVNQAADQLGDVLGGFTRGRLRTIVRTEGTRVASATRHDAAVRAVEAGWGPRWYLFSAILDDRVTRTCTFGHGHRRDVQGEQPWEQAFPAFHYNCRSIYRFLFDDSPEIEVTSEWNPESWEEFRRIQAEEFPSWAQAEGV
jgi:SPP1 gp7 family putative phage head morphogenesis protein